MTIEEGNVLIAKFLGWEYVGYGTKLHRELGKAGWYTYIVRDTDGRVLTGYPFCRTHKQLRFCNSWNAIMSVVDKIESLTSESGGKYLIIIGGHNQCQIIDQHFRSDETPYYYFNDATESTKLLAVYVAAVNFIQWYNQKEKK